MRPCGQAGCPELVAKGYCVLHAQQRDRQREARRPTAHQRGYTERWNHYSKRRLAEYPFCVICGNLARITDHIVSARHAPDRFWDPTNHQSLCHACNSRKAITEEGTFGNPPLPKEPNK